MLISPHPDVTIGVGPASRMIAQVAGPGSASLAYLDPPYGTGKHFGHYADPLVGARWAEELASTLRAVEPVLAPHATIWIHLDEVSVYAGKAVADDSWKSGFVTYDLKSDGVGYSTSGGFVDDLKTQIDEAGDKIKSGEVTVPSEPKN